MTCIVWQKMLEATIAVSRSMYTHILPTPKTTIVSTNSYVNKNAWYNTRGNTFALPSTSQNVRQNSPRK